MNNTFFSKNRADVTTKLRGGLIVLSAYTQLQRVGDSAFPFEQESNFWYLSGIERPDWLLVRDGSTDEEWLIAPDIDEVHEVFGGSLSADDAKETSGVKNVFDRDDGMNLLRQLAKKHSVVHTVGVPPHAEHFDFSLNPAILANKRLLERTFQSVVDCQKEIASLRAIKQPEEIKQIERAISLTIDAFKSIKSSLATFRHEYELEAEFTYDFRKKNAIHAYDPIVANGKNACTLHYVENRGKITAKDLTLLDIGARLGGYSADITRTYASGGVSKRKQAVHQAVVRAQQEIIGLLSPDLSLESYQRSVDAIMKRELINLGLLKSENDDAYRRYFPHAIGHGLGVDVHDSLGGKRYLEPGMVLTVEPGIYIPEEGIGVRIEDDILITKSGHRNLSAKLPVDM